MRKIAVVYKSKRGSTKQYAQWIAEETGADLFDVDQCKGSDLSDYDTIVFGGWLRAGGLQGIEFLRKNMGTFCVKDVFAFAVGLNTDGIAARQECREINFKKELEDVPCYFLPGAYKPDEIKGGDKIIMGIMKKLMDNSNPELRDAIVNGADRVDRSEIKYIVDALK
ncbi:MAG: hypothetical protein IKJ77_09190 [Firmicutes bacterium]|nr:hypothetical protein [Bacillota bacterium]